MIYIDNLDLGTLSKTHNLLPRIKQFESETHINKMIMEDKVAGQGDTAWGKSKVPLHGLVSIFCNYYCWTRHHGLLVIFRIYTLQFFPQARRCGDSCYMPSECGQPSSSRGRRPGKETEIHSRMKESNLGPKLSDDILRPASASDFWEFLKKEYPDMLDSDIVDHLKLHNARCILHSNTFKDAVIRENMRLAARILDKHSQQRNQSKPACRARDEYFSGSESEPEAKRSSVFKKSKYTSMRSATIIV
jgi:hypothetical protein